MEEYLNQGILEAQMEREQRERYIRLLRQKLKVKTTLSTCVRLFQNLMKTGDYVQAEEILAVSYTHLADPDGMIARIAESRHCLIRGNELDTEKASVLLMDDFRNGRLGRLTLEYPDAY